jgi:hypothetical protein
MFSIKTMGLNTTRVAHLNFQRIHNLTLSTKVQDLPDPARVNASGEIHPLVIHDRFLTGALSGQQASPESCFPVGGRGVVLANGF